MSKTKLQNTQGHKLCSTELSQHLRGDRNASRHKFCSAECRKKGVEKSQEKMSVHGLQNKFDHDYNFIFSSRYQDWISSPQRARENRRRKKKELAKK